VAPTASIAGRIPRPLKLSAITAQGGKVSIGARGPALGLARLLPSALLVVLVTWEVRRVVPRTGFDHSWQLALNLAAQHGLDFGRDVVFTYGPLGFLAQPLIVSALTGGVLLGPSGTASRRGSGLPPLAAAAIVQLALGVALALNGR
jgi:hypothetical protein